MPLVTASFNPLGSPVVEFTLTGTNGVAHKLDGIIDTGYSGFILLPLLRFINLGLALEGTSEYGLADGQRQIKAFGKGTAELGGKKAQGEVFLDMTGPHTLLGMQFLRELDLALVVGKTDCVLYDEEIMQKLLSNEK